MPRIHTGFKGIAVDIELLSDIEFITLCRKSALILLNDLQLDDEYSRIHVLLRLLEIIIKKEEGDTITYAYHLNKSNFIMLAYDGKIRWRVNIDFTSDTDPSIFEQ